MRTLNKARREALARQSRKQKLFRSQYALRETEILSVRRELTTAWLRCTRHMHGKLWSSACHRGMAVAWHNNIPTGRNKIYQFAGEKTAPILLRFASTGCVVFRFVCFDSIKPSRYIVHAQSYTHSSPCSKRGLSAISLTKREMDYFSFLYLSGGLQNLAGRVRRCSKSNGSYRVGSGGSHMPRVP